MTINKAIIENLGLEADLISKDQLERATGVRLGIEALKRIHFARNIGYSVPADLLPGEIEN